MKISLCIIVGNVESIIGRFLDHFQPLADEIIAVRAIGNQKSDRTLEICEKRGVRISEYFNKPDCDWPHCDDFGRARNLACDMAKNEWVMWADTDDVISAESIEQLKLLLKDIQDKEVDCVLMPYVVPEDGVINIRERIWRKGAGLWVNPIHECFKLKEDHKAVVLEHAQIVHASEPRHTSRDERNLRIIESIPEDERSISQKFHRMQSLIALDRRDDATMAAIDFVRDDEAGTNEKYEAFFQLAQLSDDLQTRITMLGQALMTDPNRREAYGELALALLTVEPEKALGLTKAMLALDMPQNPPWNLRRPYYGSLGVSLRGMALRANNAIAQADVMETNHFIKNGKKISLLHATRGRPQKAWLCRKEWLRRAKNPDAIEHIFAIDHDDEASLPLCLANHTIVLSGGCVGAWNAAAKKSRGEVLVQVSDDFEPPMGWDELILAELGDLSESKVLAVSDGNRKDDLLCMSILTRKRYEEQGYLYHPEFFSMYSDTWFSHKAFMDGAVIDARDRLVFNHYHPLFGKGEWDETYKRSNSDVNYRRGKKTFDLLMADKLTPSQVHGWCDFQNLYFALAEALPEGGKFVEVGAWLGQSIIALAQELQSMGKNVTLYCVDTWKGELDKADQQQYVEHCGGSILAQFKDNIERAGVADMIQIVEMESVQAAEQFLDGEIDGIFIDGAHDCDSVKADIAAWSPKVKQGGFFAGHDIDVDAVKNAVETSGVDYLTVGRCWIKKPKQENE